MTRHRPGAAVLALLLLAVVGLLAGCGGPAQDPADVTFRGGTVLTLGPEAAAVEAAAVDDGEVVYLGDRAGLARYEGPGTARVDLRGRALAPSFVDHHIHLYNVGTSVLNRREGGRLFIDVSGLGPGAIRDSLRRRARARPDGEWIRGKNFRLEYGRDYYPTHRPLTEAAPDNPVFFTRSGHIAWVNRAAMREAGLDASTPEIDGGRILRDASGAPTGMLLEEAVEVVTPSLPDPPREQVLRALRAGAERVARLGATEVFDAGMFTYPAVGDMTADFGRLVRLLGEADRREPLPVQVNLMVPGPGPYQDSVIAHHDSLARVSPNVRITHVKMFADGTMYCRTAALSHPFLDPPAQHRTFRTDSAELRERAARALDAGLDVAIHAIGDAAVRRVLDIYGALLEERPELDPRRLRIEHFTYASEDDLRRARELGVVLSVQPHWGPPPGPREPDPRFPADRVDQLSAWHRLSEMGARLASGSDFFGSPDPYLDLYRAAARKRIALPGDDRAADSPSGSPGREARTSALAFVTGRYAPGGGPVERGGLAVGSPADLVVLGADPLAADSLSPPGLRVDATLREGRVVFRREGALPGLSEPGEGSAAERR